MTGIRVPAAAASLAAGFHGTCDHRPEFPIFEREQAGNGAAAGRRHRVLECGRMLALC